MPNLLRFCLLSSIITVLAINTTAQRRAVRRVAVSPAIVEQKTPVKQEPVKEIPAIVEKTIQKKFREPGSMPSEVQTNLEEVIEEVEDSLIQEKSKLVLPPDCRETNAVNKAGVADSYPFISADGLRLYFTSNREGGHGRFFISSRKTIKDPFGEAIVLSKNLTDGFYAGTLTADELTLCMVSSGEMYISTRKNLQTEFGVPVQLKGITDHYHFGPAISPDGNEIIVTVTVDNNDIFKIYRKVAEAVFTEAGTLAVPPGNEPGPGQFSKDGLSYYFSLEDEKVKKQAMIWRFTRQSAHDSFVDLERLPVKTNAFQRNFQPTVNADASIIVYVTSQDDLWEEDDLVLVNDPQQAFSAPEQFTSILKNDNQSLTVKNKVASLRVKTFPNPFRGDIILELSELPAAGMTFILYDLSGKMIKQQLIFNTRTDIQLGSLPSSTYIYQVLDDRKRLISSGKLVKG